MVVLREYEVKKPLAYVCHAGSVDRLLPRPPRPFPHSTVGVATRVLLDIPVRAGDISQAVN